MAEAEPTDAEKRLAAANKSEPDEATVDGYLRRYEHSPEFMSQHRIRQCRFLLAFQRLRTISAAAREVGISREVVRIWQRDDAWFSSAFEDTQGALGDLALGEMWRRAVDGWDEPVYQKGEMVGIVRKYDGMLLHKLTSHLVPGFKDGAPSPEGAGDRGEGVWIPADKAKHLLPLLDELEQQERG